MTRETKSISVGNVITLGIVLYRSHFNQYLNLAFRAFLWSFIPIYGWAKWHMIGGVIGRLSVNQLVNKLETQSQVGDRLNPKLWNFLILKILEGGILYVVNFVVYLAQILLVAIPSMVIAVIFPKELGDILVAILSFISYLIGLGVYIWVYGRIFVADLVLAVEDNLDDVTKAFSRSWDLTGGYFGQVQLIILIAMLFSAPLYILVAIGMAILFGSSLIFASQQNMVAFIIMLLIAIVVGLFLISVVLMILLPFWQSIKAVLYYSLRSRREGTDIGQTNSSSS